METEELLSILPLSPMLHLPIKTSVNSAVQNEMAMEGIHSKMIGKESSLQGVCRSCTHAQGSCAHMQGAGLMRGVMCACGGSCVHARRQDAHGGVAHACVRVGACGLHYGCARAFSAHHDKKINHCSR